MNTINFSKNNINDILKQAKQIETEKARQNLKKKPVAKHLAQIEDTGVIDAINYAPKREWRHLFANIPLSDYIDNRFVKKDDALGTSLGNLKDIQGEKQFYKNTRNLFGGIAIGTGIAEPTLTPLGQMAGLGYLAGWANPVFATSVFSVIAGGASQLFNHLKTDDENKAIEDFSHKLGNYAKANITDMHKYWNAVDKLSKVPMTEEQALNTLSSLYTEANNKMREQHNVSLVDVYLSTDDKNNLKNYHNVDSGSYTATQFDKSMTALPQGINDNNDFYLEKGKSFTNDDNLNSDNKNDDLNKALGFKLNALENSGVTVDKTSLGLKEKPSIDDIHKALNTRYSAALDDALLIYQGKNSMASPIIEKVEKVLQQALEVFSKEAIKQAKARNLKKVPEITGQLVEKVLSAVMLQTSIPANDTKLTKILNAIANNTALKVAANLNNYASDTGKADRNKALYADATLDNLYGKSLEEKINDQIIRLNPNSDKDIFTKISKMKLSDESKKIIMKRAAKKIETKNGIKIYPSLKDDKCLTRRWKNIPVGIAPKLFGKDYIDT